jgi:hypothetical protein
MSKEHHQEPTALVVSPRPDDAAPAAKPAAVSPVPVVAARTAPKAAAEDQPPTLPTWDVTHNGEVSRVQAVNDREAWAMVCDSKKSHPNPKTGMVHRDGKQVYPAVK